jgi:hypothetical protein
LLEDSGWYVPNYGAAQNSPFGLGDGCEFVNNNCIITNDEDGHTKLADWANGTFCWQVVV